MSVTFLQVGPVALAGTLAGAPVETTLLTLPDGNHAVASLTAAGQVTYAVFSPAGGLLQSFSFDTFAGAAGLLVGLLLPGVHRRAVLRVRRAEDEQRANSEAPQHAR